LRTFPNFFVRLGAKDYDITGCGGCDYWSQPALTSPGGFGAMATDRVSGQIIARTDNTFEVNQQFHHNGQVTSRQSEFAFNKDSKIGFLVAYDKTENRPIGSNVKVYCNNQLFQPTWALKPPRPQWLQEQKSLLWKETGN